jgi:transcriptional regulator with XRE-family HTH domain
MTSTPPPAAHGSAGRARLASALRAARKDSGLVGVDAGQRAGMSQSKVSKIERGFLLPSADDVAALCRAYGVPDSDQGELLALARSLHEESSARVRLARGTAEMQRRIGQLEASATLVRSYQPVMVVGLVQTAAYMRCVFGIPDSRELAPGEVDSAVAAREKRQRVLSSPGRRFELVMSEGALRWQAGSAALMADQVHAVADAVSLPNVKLGIIPWTTPVRYFPLGGFHIYDDDAVLFGTEVATATLTAVSDVATYAELFTDIADTAAYGDEAREHLARIEADYRRLAG